MKALPWPLLCFSHMVIAGILCLAAASELGPEEWAEGLGLETGGLSRESFPKGFLFGTASSAYQVEGMTDKAGRGPCIWDPYVKIPGQILFSLCIGSLPLFFLLLCVCDEWE